VIFPTLISERMQISHLASRCLQRTISTHTKGVTLQGSAVARSSLISVQLEQEPALHFRFIPDRNELNPLNLSILLSGGKENNSDDPSSGERKGLSTAGNSFGNLSCVNLDSLCWCSVSGKGHVAR